MGTNFWPKRVCHTEQVMVCGVLIFKQGVQFHYLVSGAECLFGPEAFKRV